MKIIYFTHSLISCWNHGNAHFLRGVMRTLLGMGHDVNVYEPAPGWSRKNLIQEHGEQAVGDFNEAFPVLENRIRPFATGDEPAIEAALDGADLVLVHEWNEPELVASIGKRRAQGARFLLLFHDTHHRMVSQPEAMSHYDLSAYDGVLAFGATLSEAYRKQGWGDRVFTWHEAADIALFHPPAVPVDRHGAVWIGNWGDGERSEGLRDYMLDPVAHCGVALDIYGVRYPEEVKAELVRRGIQYHGWLANARVPEVFSQHLFALHVPRSFYVTHLPGVPTIRVFEALASGIPLLSAPWKDSEALFTPGADFLQARNPAEMALLMRDLLNDNGLRAELSAHGLATIRARHTCAHRVQELLTLTARLRGCPGREAA